MAVQIRLAAHAFGAGHALAVVAGLRPGAVAVVEALRELASRLALADADLASLPFAAVLAAGAHHRTFPVTALVAGQTLLPALGGRGRRAPVRRLGDVAVAERFPLAGPCLARSRILSRRGHRRAGFVHALQAVRAVQVARARVLDPLAAVAGRAGEAHGQPGGGGDQHCGERSTHLNTSFRTTRRLCGSSTLNARSFLSMRRERPVNTLPGPSSMTVSTPDIAMRCTDSTQRTGAVTWLSKSSRIRAGSVFGSAVTLATIGADGCLSGIVPSTSARRGCTGAISEQWKGAETGSGNARLAPRSFDLEMARSTAGARRPDRIMELHGAGRDQRRVLAQRMAGVEQRELEPAARLLHQHAVGGDGDGEDRGLRVGRLAQLLLGALEEEPQEPPAEGRVGLVEHRARLGIGLRQRLAHPHRLRTLPRKDERDRHVPSGATT